MNQDPSANVRKPAHRGRRLVRGLCLLALALILLGWFLPLLVSRTPLRHRLAAWVFHVPHGTVRVGTASLYWLSPVELGDLTIDDDDGCRVLSVAHIATERTLFQLLTASTDLGTIRLQQPVLHITSAPDETNLERVFVSCTSSDEEAETTCERTALQLEVEDGQVEVEEIGTGWHCTLQALQCSLTTSAVPSEPLSLTLSSKLTAAGESGTLEADVSLRWPSENNLWPERGKITLKSTRLPLELAGMVLRRFDPAAHLSGRLNVRLTCSWDTDQHFEVDGEVRGDQLEAGTRCLGPERVQLDWLFAPVHLIREGHTWRSEHSLLDSDLGGVSAHGSLPIGPDLLDTLRNARGELSAYVDLARLARSLPRNLCLRPGINVTSGRLFGKLHREEGEQGQAWSGSLRSTDLKARLDGRPLSWSEPIAFDFSAHQPGGGALVVDRLQFQSDFLQANVQGPPEHLTGKASVNLDRLTSSLSRFVDLGTLRAGGTGTAQLDVRRDGAGALAVQATGAVQQFLLAGHSCAPWSEPKLSFRLNASGRAPCGEPLLIHSASLRLTAEHAGAEVQLLHPIASVRDLALLDCRVSADGDIAAWQRRLLPCLPCLGKLNVAGTMNATARLTFDPLECRINEAHVIARDFQLRGPLHVDEPTVELRSQGIWRPTGTLELRNVDLRMAAATISAARIQFAPFTPGLGLAGSATVQGELTRLQRWFQPDSTPQGTFAGRIAGEVSCQPGGADTDLQLDLTALDLRYGLNGAPTWKDPRLHLVCQARHDPRADQLALSKLQLESALVGCSAAGRIDHLKGDCDLHLAGQVHYDLARLAPLLQPAFDDNVQLRGNEARPFRLEGSLAGHAVPLRLSLIGEAEVLVASADLFGLQLSAMPVRTRLREGWVRAQRLEASLNEGRFLLQPSLRLAPVELHLAEGPVLERTRITPAMCARALGSIAPVLAQAVDVDGQVSLMLDQECTLPLGNRRAARAAGRLIIHRVQVRASPLLQVLSILLNTAPEMTLARESVVAFQLIDGRIYHQNLELVFPKATIRTSGSVGLDGTLSLVAELPVPKHWFGTGRAAAALGQQTIRIPIGGTLSRPQLDTQALREESKSFLRKSTGDSIRQEVEKQLDHLFRSRH